MPFEKSAERTATRKLSDPRAMRAMAHPTRLELMELIGREGELTATRAGELLGLSPANCSFHLRQLAKYGFVEEAAGGSGRNRPWRLVSLSHEWSESDLDTEASAAATALSMVVLEREMERLAGWFERQRDEPAEWRDASTSSSAILYLTPEELNELGDTLGELVARYLGRVADPSLRPPGSRPVAMIAAAYPLVPTPSGG
ncbi:MAG: ArsR/SmtB family transcription factor [Gaiellales bacterium]